MPTVVVREGNREVWRGTITTWRVTIGAGPRCDIQLSGDRIATEHARLAIRDDQLLLEDSCGETFVNDQQIRQRVIVREHDAIRIGTLTLHARIEGAARSVVETVADADSDATDPGMDPPRDTPPAVAPRPPTAPFNPPMPVARRPDPAVRFVNPPFPQVAPPDTERAPQEAPPSTTRTPFEVEAAEASFIDALRKNPKDDDTRLVYADWLEERSQKIKAQFVRLQLVEHEAEDDALHELHSSRLRALAPASDAPWRAIVSRPRIEKCPRQSECVKQWSALEPTPDNDRVRHCTQCKADVHYCGSLVDVVRNGRERNPVAVDVSLTREEALEAYDA